MRRLLLLLAVALTVLGGGPAYAGEDLTSLTNADRAAHGLPALTTARDLQQFAQRRAQEMARTGKLAHTANLGAKIRDWERLGENVGRGPYMKDIERSFMASETHRRNILFPTFSQVGTGVASDGHLLYVVAVFREPEAPPPAQEISIPARPRAAAPARRPAAVPTTAPAPPPAPPVEVAPEVSLPAEPAPMVEPAPAPEATLVVEATPSTTPPGPRLGPGTPTEEALALAQATKSFRGYEAPAGKGGGGSPIAPLSLLAVGGLGLTATALRRRRRAAPAEVTVPTKLTSATLAPAPPVRAVAPKAPARPRPPSARQPSSRVGRHKTGGHRSKSKRKRR